MRSRKFHISRRTFAPQAVLHQQLNGQLAFEHSHRRTADFNCLYIISGTNHFNVGFTGTRHPMSLLCNKAGTLDQPVMPKISRHASCSGAGERVFQGVRRQTKVAGKGPAMFNALYTKQVRTEKITRISQSRVSFQVWKSFAEGNMIFKYNHELGCTRADGLDDGIRKQI